MGVPMPAPATYLVTGGAGFIGSHLADALLGRGHTVPVLDDLSTGARANLAASWSDPRLRFVRGSVLDEPPGRRTHRALRRRGPPRAGGRLRRRRGPAARARPCSSRRPTPGARRPRGAVVVRFGDTVGPRESPVHATATDPARTPGGGGRRPRGARRRHPRLPLPGRHRRSPRCSPCWPTPARRAARSTSRAAEETTVMALAERVIARCGGASSDQPLPLRRGTASRTRRTPGSAARLPARSTPRRCAS